MKVKQIVILAITGLMSLTATSARLTPEEALARALESETTLQKARAMSVNSPSLRLAFSVREATESPVYVFNGESGFLVVSGDDRSETPVLGYGEGEMSGSMPSNMSAWLELYSRQMARNVSAGSPKSATNRPSITPLVTCRWDQDAPYNNKAPEVYGTRSVTGCVATAMAQIMYYWKYPEKGTGTKSYSYSGWPSFSINNYSFTHTYDWANMKDTYTGSYTNAQANAVALLMYDCGIASEMEWSPYGSGAMTENAGQGLIENLKYDKSMNLIKRSWYYTQSGWNDLVYAELQAGRPVMYGGYGDGGGHQFVCDGYSQNEYFHFNWGWSGSYDGYFLLTALNPEGQGIGGNDDDGFNEGCDIVQGFQPAQEGSKLVPRIYVNTKFQVGSTQYNHSTGNVMFQGDFCSATFGEITFQLGVEIVANGISEFLEGNSTPTLGPLEYVGSYTVSASKFPVSGTYKVYPAIKYDGEWTRMKYDVSTTGPLTATCTTTAVKFSSSYGSVESGVDEPITPVEPPAPELTLADIALSLRDATITLVSSGEPVEANELEENTTYNITYTATTAETATIKLQLEFVKDNEVIKTSTEESLTCTAGETQEVTFRFSTGRLGMSAGDKVKIRPKCSFGEEQAMVKPIVTISIAESVEPEPDPEPDPTPDPDPDPTPDPNPDPNPTPDPEPDPSDALITVTTPTITGIYPNPVRDTFVVGGLESPTRVEIYSLDGRKVYSGIVGNGESVDVSGLSRGNYIVKVGRTALRMVKGG